MTDIPCTNKSMVNKLCDNEPENFYDELYKILENDSNTFDLQCFKRFYIVRRLPLYNITLEKEALKIVENEMNNNNKNINRIFKTIIEDNVGHGKDNNSVDMENINCLYHYNHNKLGKVITAPHVITNMSHIIIAMKYGIDVKNYDLILEFGGGYGGMAKICNGMGYNNTYYIYDLPQLKKIQEYHLTEINVKHKIINELKELKDIMLDNTSSKKLFIATWSLSEVGNELREQIIEIIKDFDSVFIVFQHNNPIKGQDNYEYFYNSGSFQKMFNNIDTWTLKKMEFVPWDGGSYYFIGNNKEKISKIEN
tara:strand:- start:54 stop:980 length:927 start_codon:yes stop_codon:yes gene_type:complete